MLNPILQPITLFTVISAALVTLFIALAPWHPRAFLALSLIFLCIFLIVFTTLLQLLAEVKALIDKREQEDKDKLFTLVARLDKETPTVKLISVTFLKNEEKLTELICASDRQYKLKIRTCNSELTLTAREVETGIEIPKDFKIESVESSADVQYGITALETANIVRFRKQTIHYKTDQTMGYISLLPLKAGSGKIETWIKGENVKAQHVHIKYTVAE